MLVIWGECVAGSFWCGEQGKVIPRGGTIVIWNVAAEYGAVGDRACYSTANEIP
jgi:hypothetical protein